MNVVCFQIAFFKVAGTNCVRLSINRQIQNAKMRNCCHIDQSLNRSSDTSFFISKQRITEKEKPRDRQAARRRRSSPSSRRQMRSLLLSPAPPRPPLPTLRWRPVSSPAPKPRFSAPSRGAATVGTGTSSCAACRSSLPRHRAPAAASGPSEPTPLSAEDEAERAKLAKVPITRVLG